MLSKAFNTRDYEIINYKSLDEWKGYKFPKRVAFFFYCPVKDKWIKVYMDYAIAEIVGFNRYKYANHLFAKTQSLGYDYVVRNYERENEYYVFYFDDRRRRFRF